MGTTRTEQAIDDFDPLGDDASCEDFRLAWLANEVDTERGSDELDALWADR